MIIPHHDKSRNRKKKNLTKKLSILNAYINFKLSKVSNSRDYVELSAKGYSKYMKWENIKSLLRLAVISNRLTKEQAQFLKPKMAYKSPKLENISYICYNYDIEKFLIIYFAFSV